jgi:3-oxoadipate enol-lactonase
MSTLTDECDPDGAFAWRAAGDRAGVPIVFLHGLGGSRPAWDAQLAGLGDRWMCAAWDLPGYGASSPLREPVTFAALAAAAARFIGRFGPSAHVVGMSFGGMIAQYLAAFHPSRVRSLTLMCTSPKFGLDGTNPIEWRAARLRPLDQGVQPADFAHAVLSSLAGPSIKESALASQVAAMTRISAHALRTSIECLGSHDSQALLGGISAPTQCLVGDLDQETPIAYSEAISSRILGATTHVIGGGGHLLHVEYPDEVNRLIETHCEQAEVAMSGTNQ